eukprot:TRINITY_DN9208_c0_g1_i1.p1 TRINITY_DN9208_c0_g1~~TRINITY_DN9208_c0_g1_i1.p1  ORF type:complete len:790 (+),score=102.78 TRINITY_DN9208_c0_g1_i1:305-2371(+)
MATPLSSACNRTRFDSGLEQVAKPCSSTTLEVPSSRRRSESWLSWQEDAEVAAVTALKPPDITVTVQSVGHHPDPRQRKHYISLCNAGLLSRTCCQFPGICLVVLLVLLVVAALISQAAFYRVTAVLTIYVLIWTTNMAIFSAVGGYKMRAWAQTDWSGRLRTLLSEQNGLSTDSQSIDDSIMHIVILPNYKEDEEMLLETLMYLSTSPSASECMRIVLGMEEREGPEGQEKAKRLIEQTKHLFVDMLATFHPPKRPGEIAGKSSNTQWAYQELLGHWASDLGKYDPKRVFLSVGDADTLWHPQYFDALAFSALSMNSEESSWRIWQPPMLLTRNLFAVPGVTRLSGIGTLLFELAGLANQYLGTHFSFSSYSLTLALASHNKVAGWDTDVIAEDHHMFCKCFFGSLWEEAEQGRSKLHPKLQLCPIYLPAQGYLVESSEGWLASCIARFQQARRHAQGVSELGYVLLQYLNLLCAGHGLKLSLRGHYQVWAIMMKMITVHIVNAVQAFSLIIAGFITAPVAAAATLGAVRSLIRGDSIFALVPAALGAAGVDAESPVAVAKWALLAAFGPLAPVSMLTGYTVYIVVLDVVEGRYWRPLGIDTNSEDSNGTTAVAGDSPSTEVAEGQAECLSLMQRIILCLSLQADMMFLAEPTVFLYGMLPEILAAWSILRKGMQFEYIVAAKPDSK